MFLFVFCFTLFANFIYIFFDFLFLWQNINLCAFQMVFRLYFPLSPARSVSLYFSLPLFLQLVCSFSFDLFLMFCQSPRSLILQHSFSISFTLSLSLCQSFLSLSHSLPLSLLLFSPCVLVSQMDVAFSLPFCKAPTNQTQKRMQHH